ncbi:MAG: hypothetical protein AB1540_07920 [Bdellovibrionota bacterium]
MTVLSWLGIQPKIEKPENQRACLTTYLTTGGAEIWAQESPSHEPIHIRSGEKIALVGTDNYRKHFFCDWILGFVELPQSRVEIQTRVRSLQKTAARTTSAVILGRSPLLYGDTIQESLLYRTSHVRKEVLYELVERLYGPSLKKRTDPKNRLLDLNAKPIPTQLLTAREHIEISQINALLQKTPILVFDLSSTLMLEAFAQGYTPCPELSKSGKTWIVILPPDQTVEWAESLLRVGLSLSF